jgi:hypothetical protein
MCLGGGYRKLYETLGEIVSRDEAPQSHSARMGKDWHRYQFPEVVEVHGTVSASTRPKCTN